MWYLTIIKYKWTSFTNINSTIRPSSSTFPWDVHSVAAKTIAEEEEILRTWRECEIQTIDIHRQILLLIAIRRFFFSTFYIIVEFLQSVELLRRISSSANSVKLATSTANSFVTLLFCTEIRLPYNEHLMQFILIQLVFTVVDATFNRMCHGKIVDGEERTDAKNEIKLIMIYSRRTLDPWKQEQKAVRHCFWLSTQSNSLYRTCYRYADKFTTNNILSGRAIK